MNKYAAFLCEDTGAGLRWEILGDLDEDLVVAAAPKKAAEELSGCALKKTTMKDVRLMYRVACLNGEEFPFVIGVRRVWRDEDGNLVSSTGTSWYREVSAKKVS